MSLAQRLTGRRGGGACTMPGVFATLSRRAEGAAEVAALEQALADPDVPSSRIERALRGEGVAISRAKVDWHRRGLCSCPTENV